MSVVCWDGKTLAADRQGTGGGVRMESQKLYQLSSGAAAAFVGDPDRGLLLIEWVENGSKDSEFPGCPEVERSTILIVAHQGECYVCYGEYHVLHEVLHGYAWGSGAKIALGALAMGSTAVQAVEAAIKWSVECGMGLDSFDVSAPAPKKPPKRKAK